MLFRIVAAWIAMLTSSFFAVGGQTVREPAATFAGTFKKSDAKRSTFFIEVADGNTMQFRVTRKTRVGGKASRLEDLEDGDTVEVEGRRILREVVAEKVTVTLRAKEKSQP